MNNSFVQGSARNNKAVKVGSIDEAGLHLLSIANLGDADVVMGLRTRSGGKYIVDASGIASKVSSESQYDGGSLANTPVVPGTVEVKATSITTLVDRDRDGILRLDRTPESILVSKSNGATSGATLTSAGTNFTTEGVVAGDELVIKRGESVGKYTVATVSTTTLTVSTPFPATETDLPFVIIAVDLAVGLVDYFTGLLNLSYPSSPSAASPANKGTVLGTTSFPINLSPDDTLDISIDGGADDTATFVATRAKLTASGGSFAAMSSETMEVRFAKNGVFGEWQTITFGTEASIQAAVDLINAQMTGGYAVAQGAEDVDIYSDGFGTGATAQTQNVAAGITTKLGIADDGDEDGTGDVADIDAVTFAEAKAVIEADVADSLCESDGGKLRITSDSSNEDGDSTVQVKATSSAEAKFGLDTDEHAGDDDDAKQPITVDYMTSTVVSAGKVAQRRVVGRVGDIVDMYFAAKAAPSKVIVTIQQDTTPR